MMDYLRRLILITTLLAALGGSSATLAAAATPFECKKQGAGMSEDKLLAAVEKRYEEVSSVSGTFTQSSYFAGLERSEMSSGKVQFKKPGMMDWSYEEPELQRFVADGKTLWYFQPKDNQVTVGDFQNSFSTDLPVSFLLGIGHLKERFKLKSSCRTEEGVLLDLQPLKADQSLETFQLLVSAKDFSPLGAKVVDLGGNETAIALHKLTFNQELRDDQFVLQIPRGVDIIDRRAIPALTGTDVVGKKIQEFDINDTTTAHN